MARIEGGAIKWNFYKPKMTHNVLFEGNTAFMYGDSIASIPKYFIKIDPQQENLKGIRHLESNIT